MGAKRPSAVLSKVGRGGFTFFVFEKLLLLLFEAAAFGLSRELRDEELEESSLACKSWRGFLGGREIGKFESQKLLINYGEKEMREKRIDRKDRKRGEGG
jgi:hypothetical protein